MAYVNCWESKLLAWHYPSDEIDNFSSALYDLGITPDMCPNPLSLYNRLKPILDTKMSELGYTSLLTCEELPMPVNFLCMGLAWLWNTYIAPFWADIVLMIIGGVAIYFLPGAYKAIGAAPIVYSIYDVFVKLQPK